MSLGLASVLPILSTQTHASDIEIYEVPKTGQKTIVLMLDTSGSMALCDTAVTFKNMWVGASTQQNVQIDNLYSINYWVYGWNVTNVSDPTDARVVENRNRIRSFLGSDPGPENMYQREFCYEQRSDGAPDLTKKHYSRMTRLKDAVFALMDSDKLNEDVVMGIGIFHSSTQGKMLIPARRLTPEHKALIKREVARIGASGQTPTANAYAELASYLLGTTTYVDLPDETVHYETELYAQLYQKTVNGKTGFVFAKCMQYNSTNPAQCDSVAGHVGERDRVTNDRSVYPEYPSIATVLPSYVYKACAKSEWGSNWCIYDKNARTVPVTFNATSFVKATSGFPHSASSTKNGSNYQSPLPTSADAKKCGGQALYFLTDGYPNNAPTPEYLMKAALGNKGAEMPTNGNKFKETGNLIYAAGEGMAQAGILAKILRDPARNPAGVEIKTAVVGFGSDFESAEKNTVNLTVTNALGEPKIRKFYNCDKLTIPQVKNACNWGEKSHQELPKVGGFGEGGFFYAKNSDDIIQSVLDVVNDIPIQTPDVKTGSPTIPIDSLNRQAYIHAAYYADFSPRPEKLYQLWKGNMGKYNILNGVIVGQKNEPLFNTLGENNDAAKALWGAVENLPLQKAESNTARMVYTNRTINGNVGANSGTLSRVDLNALFSGTFRNDPYKNYWLNFLGYVVAKDATVTENTLPTTELRQMGATMHSTPIMLTQKGKVEESGYNLNISEREDYLLYGSTQGALHIVDEKTGKEKFAFVPHEMLETQRDALLSFDSTSGGRNSLFYGIDAPWTAHTVYAIDTKGVSTVQPVVQDEEDQPAHQWVYGGLRMGGRSYYALDLTNINSPSLKFHIDPTSKRVYTRSGSKEFPQIGNMGQSWSKPVLGYVNWKNAQGVKEKKLVMFVGGGYDAGGNDGNGTFTNGVRTGYAGYESSNYKQNNKRGAGVYMFDADNGDLLWWASANQDRWNTTTTRGVKYLSAPDMQYSVVSRINAIDRNSDGLIDNLYFGDLGGQAFRIDLNNEIGINDSSATASRVTRLFTENKADGTSPRFYMMPSVAIFMQSAEEGGNGQRFATVSFVSGDTSSPLAGTNYIPSTSSTVTTPTAEDGVFVAYDNDLGRNDLYSTSFTATATATSTLPENDLSVGVKQLTTDGRYNRGWKYIYPVNKSAPGFKKGLNEPYTFVNFLFASIYEKGDGRPKTTDDEKNKCGGGVRGESTLEMFCLPTGKCEVATHGFTGTSKPPSTPIGRGNVGATLGSDGDKQHIVNVVGSPKKPNPDPDPNPCPKGSSDPRCQGGPSKATINQLRWYESK